MRARVMPPLCCISANCGNIGAGDRSPLPEDDRAEEVADAAPCEPAVAGVLYKWTNYGRGWRSRWFSLRNGILSYSKIRRRAGDGGDLIGGGGARLIGNASELFSLSGAKLAAVVYLKV